MSQNSTRLESTPELHDGIRDLLLIPKQQGFKMIGVGNTKGHELINAGEIEAVKQGARTMLVPHSLRRYAARLPRVGGKAA